MGVQIDGVNGTVKTGSSNVHNTGYSGGDGVFTGDLNVAGTLTYEDVTRVDALGLSTYREGLHIGPHASIGATVYKDGSIRSSGIITATSFSGSGANLTGLASREIYGFAGINSHLQLTYTNSGADNISGTDFAAFEDEFIGPSGITWSINNNGNLIATI